MRIGVFDSGVGGLTVLSAIRKHFPSLDLLYLGDTARVPYGSKSPETVIRYSRECAEFLVDKGIEVLVLACNTASSHAIEVLAKEYDIPIVGVVDPGVKKALSVTKGKVGVIGTSATINSGAYQKRLTARGVEVVSKDCPLFVPLVEEGLVEGQIAKSVVEFYLKELKLESIDTLILGCTHYPMLKGVIESFMEGVEVIDSSDAVAQELHSFVRDEGNGITHLYFTDRSQNLDRLIELILGERLSPEIVEGSLFRT